MFSTYTLTKNSSPFQDSANITDTGTLNPRTGRFVSSIHQFVLSNDVEAITGSNIALPSATSRMTQFVVSTDFEKSTHLKDSCEES